jgi:YbbR domain-containing protein
MTLPSGVRVVRLSPSSVEVMLERIARKEVPVKAVFSGTPMPGYTLGPVAVKPSKVMLVGAESELKPVTQVETDPVDLSGIQASFQIEKPLRHSGTYTRLEPVRQVEVTVTIIPPTVIMEQETKEGAGNE